MLKKSCAFGVSVLHFAGQFHHPGGICEVATYGTDLTGIALASGLFIKDFDGASGLLSRAHDFHFDPPICAQTGDQRPGGMGVFAIAGHRDGLLRSHTCGADFVSRDAAHLHQVNFDRLGTPLGQLGVVSGAAQAVCVSCDLYRVDVDGAQFLNQFVQCIFAIGLKLILVKAKQ